MKIPGNGKGGELVVRQVFEMQRLKGTLHPVFHEPSKYAITVRLAQRLTREPRFNRGLRPAKIANLDQLGNTLAQGGKVIRDPGRFCLQLYVRFLSEERVDNLTCLISDQFEMGPSGDFLKTTPVLLEGRFFLASVRTIERHMRVLREQNNLRELMDFARQEEAVFASPAIDELAKLKQVPEVREFLLGRLK